MKKQKQQQSKTYSRHEKCKTITEIILQYFSAFINIVSKRIGNLKRPFNINLMNAIISHLLFYYHY